MIEDSKVVVDHSGIFKTPDVRFDTFAYDIDDNIVAISGRSLKVVSFTEKDGSPYFQAWVNGYQNDGLSHNEAVRNALGFAQKNKRSY